MGRSSTTWSEGRWPWWSRGTRGAVGPLARLSLCVVVSSCHGSAARSGEPAPQNLTIDESTLERLMAEEDCDGDKRLTIHDLTEARRSGGRCSADGEFVLRSRDGSVLRFRGSFQLSRLLTELEIARREHRSTIDLVHVYEDPVTAVSRDIRERYWDGLTRRIDAQHLHQVLEDTKVSGNHTTLFVPYDDPPTLAYFEHAASTASSGDPFSVRQLPERVSPEWVRGLGTGHGPLALALRGAAGKQEGVPYVVPGGRFNELYGWDSYFHVLGLLRDHRPELARDIVENLRYEIEHYGRILNANRTYYLTRSQPPFFTSMLRALADVPARAWTGAAPDEAWIERSVRAAVKEYVGIWQGPLRRSSLCAGASEVIPLCLAHYFDEGTGEPPEVEPGHFTWIYEKYAKRRDAPLDAYVRGYRDGSIREPDLDRFFTHDRCMRESGHDTTYRWFDADRGEDRCADYATVDLNSLLYKLETDIAHFLRQHPSMRVSSTDAMNHPRFWCDRARARADLIRKHLFDPASTLFFDYDLARGRRSTYVSATTLYPLWASELSDGASIGCNAELLTREEARAVAREALRRLECPGGLSATSADSVKPFALSKPRQWDYPNGWAPHQMLAWEGLRRFGLDDDTSRLVYKWLHMIAKNASLYAGTVPEKFDVVARSHRVYAEYGNVGTDFRYITDEGFGWMNASFEDGLARLSPELVVSLRELREPDETFAR